MIKSIEPLLIALLFAGCASGASAAPSDLATPWKAQVSKAILEGRCDDAKTLALQANDLDVAEQALRLCKPAINTIAKIANEPGADQPIDKANSARVQRVEQPKNGSAPIALAAVPQSEQKVPTTVLKTVSEISPSSVASNAARNTPQAADQPPTLAPADQAAYTGKTVLGFDEPTTNLHFLSNAAEVDVTVSILGTTFWLEKVDRKKAPLIQSCRTPCFVKIPVNHEFKVRVDPMAGWRFQSMTTAPKWKSKFFTGPYLEPSFIRVNIIRSPTTK